MGEAALPVPPHKPIISTSRIEAFSASIFAVAAMLLVLRGQYVAERASGPMSWQFLGQ
jgi:hypothetical protein